MVAFQEQIRILADLQTIDAEIYRFRVELATFPQIEKDIQADFERKRAGLKAAEDELKTLQLKHKEKDMELKTKEDHSKKLQGQLYQLKTNKEYATMELEIKSLKADASVLEEEILKLYDVMDAAKNKCAKEKEVLSSFEKKAKEEVETLKRKAAEIHAEIATLEDKRKIFSPQVEPKLLSQYERILKGREGLALVPVEKDSCGGCHLELPPQTVNEIQMKDKLITCESCARILYWPS